MKHKANLYGAILVLIILILLIINYHNNKSNENEYSEEIKSIEIEKIKFLMTRDEVERLYGLGPDKTPGCFGCELNFIYPDLKLSGRYSETLGRTDKKGEIYWNKSPKVKQLTIAKDNFSILGVRLGSSIKDAKDAFEKSDFILQSNPDKYFYNYYYKGSLYVRLWTDNEINKFKKDNSYLGEDQEIVRSITLEIRVKQDEEIQY